MYSERENDFIIRANGISKRFDIYDKPINRLKHLLFKNKSLYSREFWALKNIEFDVGRGETLAIVGRNGSGKSTLLQILCGTLKPTSGSVKVNGRISALLELGAGFNPEFTGRENVYLNASVLGLSRKDIENKFEEIEKFAEIGDYIDQPVKTYSSGMYVRLAFSVAIHVEPQVLIVDEALAVGDARFQAKCMNKIKKMKGDGVTILFVSHDVTSVRTLCERAIWLDNGNMRMMDDAFKVTSQYMQHLFENECNVDTDINENYSSQIDIVEEQNLEKLPNSKLIENHAEPINHWGSHIGNILSAGVYDREGIRKDLFEGFEPILIKIRLRIPDRANKKNLSVAFSIKDLKGTDLIVSTTHDQKVINFDESGEICEIEFRLINRLNNGKYLLAVALEDRSGAVPMYYEYIEGAQYFTSHFEGEYFGMFIPEIEQMHNFAKTMA